MPLDDPRRPGGSHSSRRLRRAAVSAAVVLAAAAGAAQAAEPGIPTDIQIPEGNKLYLEVHATGVQIYDCVAVAGGYAWSAATPRAELYGDNGKLIGIHYGGPTWEAQGRQQGRRQARHGRHRRPDRDPVAAAGRHVDQRRA